MTACVQWSANLVNAHIKLLTLYVIETSTLCVIDVRHQLFVSLMFVLIVSVLCVYHVQSIVKCPKGKHTNTANAVDTGVLPQAAQ